MEFLNQYLAHVDMFILILIRMAGIFVIAPVFGARNLPTYLKIGLSLMTSLIIASTMQPVDLNYGDSYLLYGVLVFKEVVVGIIIGFVSYLIFSAIFMAGELIDMQMGFSIVSVMDPLSNISVPITGNFYYILTLLVFLMADGHHVLLSALFKSYESLPLGSAVFNNNLLDTIIRLTNDIFVIGFKIAAPVILATLITDVSLGILTRTIPQLNMFVVGIPIKIIIGILVIFITMPAFINVVDVLIGGAYHDTVNVLKDMVPK